MSYEGFVQSFCTNGHLTYRNCYDDDTACVGTVDGKDCTAPVAFEVNVDDTNCEQWGVIPPFVLASKVKTPRQTKTCGECSHTHLVSDVTYNISPEEVEGLRHFYDGKNYILLPRRK